MSKIIELREKRAKVWEQAKAFLDEKRGENGLLSAEDTATYEKMETEVVNLGKEVERLERQASIDLELSKATSTALKTIPGDEPKGRASNEYGKAFWQYMRNRNSYEARNALTIGGDGTEGGYLVPDEFERTLIEALEEENIMRTLAKVITTSTGDRKIPVVASKGVATWVDEEGPYQDKDDAFDQVSIGAYKVATMIKVSEELLNDSVFNLESYIAKEFARRIGAKEEEAFLVGDGEGKPTGIFDSDGGGEIGATTAGAALKADEVFDLFYSLKAPYRKKAVFIMNDATVKEIRKLKDGNGVYLWQPSLTAGDPDTLLNRPVKTSAYVPTIAAGEKVIAFGDMGYYWIADRQGRIFQRLNELYAATGQAQDTIEDDGETVMKHYVQRNCLDIPGMEFPNLTIAPNQHRGPRIKWQSRYKNLADELEEISRLTNLGWHIYPDFNLRRWIFDIYNGRDFSVGQNINPPVIFSPEFDNVKGQEFIDSLIGYGNYAIIAGQGEGEGREILTMGDAATGLYKHVIFVDARDIENPADLPARGEVRLGEHQRVLSFQSEVLPTGPFEYEKDWDVGDIVTVQNKDWGLTMDVRITEVEEVYETSGFRLNIIFGKSLPTLSQKLKSSLNEFKRESTR